MPKIVDGKIYHEGQKIGWIDGEHIRGESGNKLGYWQGDFIYNDEGRKIAYIKDDELHFENGQPSISLQHINEKIEGTYPLNVKCAVHALLED